MEKKLVISFDGGGLRGVWTITILARLFDKYPDLRDKVELYAGTSTGGIIAIMMAGGAEPQAVKDLYEKEGPAIFTRSRWRKWKTMSGYTGPKHNNDKLIEVVKRIMGETIAETIKDLPAKVIVPTFDLFYEKKGRWSPSFFHNYSESGKWDEPCWKLAIKTSSAPGYFPPFEGYVDGGVAANNPSMIALGRLVSEYGISALDEMVFLSIGTTDSNSKIEPPKDWGFLKWTKPLIGVFMEGIGSIPDYQCYQLAKNYMRVNQSMNDGYDFDDPKVVPVLAKAAENYDIGPVEEFLKSNNLI